MCDMKLAGAVQSAGLLIALSLAPFVAMGCASGPSQDQMDRDRQAAALKDPFGYNPDPHKSEDTVSGNGEFDKDAFKKDLDHVINP